MGDYLCVKVDRYAKLKKEKGEVKYSVCVLRSFLINFMYMQL